MTKERQRLTWGIRGTRRAALAAGFVALSWLATYDRHRTFHTLREGRLLYTFTVRALNPPLGVQALLGTEQDDGFTFDFDVDRLVIDGQTPMGKPQGGGFGPTVQLEDGTLVTSYSYRGEDDKTHVEVVRWKLP